MNNFNVYRLAALAYLCLFPVILRAQTSANTPNTIVLRDGTGGFACETISLPYSSSVTAGTITQNGALLIGSDGFFNFFAGANAGNFSSGGSENVAIGANSLQNITGKAYSNTANGVSALQFNTTGFDNTAVGEDALQKCMTGNENTALGSGALNSVTTGIQNIAVGIVAGTLLTTGSNNICIGNFGTADDGTAGNSGVIRIGNAQTATYIAGVAGAKIASGNPVYVDINGHLGNQMSSRRFKQNIADMDKTSEAIFSLRPVTFRYKPEFDAKGILQCGLIAEEVNEVNPDLAVRDDKGEIQMVRYEQVNAMLLNEFLKDHRRAQEREVEIRDLKGKNAALEKRLAEVEANERAREARLEKLERLMPSPK